MLNNNRMKRVSIGFVLIFLMTNGCAGSFSSEAHHYLYTYALVSPIANENLIYKDQYIIIQFKFDESAVRFQMQNVSEAPMSIEWENASISLNRRTFAVKNWTTFYSLSPNTPPSVIIPPLGYIREIIIPRDRIYYENNEWVEDEMFPTKDKGSTYRKRAILRYKGSQVKLNLPILIGEAVKDYTFIFRVKDISPLPEKTLPAKKERPPVPKTPFQMGGASQSVVPIVITTGILGVVVILLTQKKSPPGDL